MSPLVLLGAGAAAVWFFTRSRAGSGASSDESAGPVGALRWVAVVDEDGSPLAKQALFKAQPYIEAGAPFGPGYPGLYTQDEGGLFVFGNGKFWKPTYVVTVR